MFAHVLVRVPELEEDASLVVESAGVGSAMMNTSRRKKWMMWQSMEEDRKVIK